MCLILYRCSIFCVKNGYKFIIYKGVGVTLIKHKKQKAINNIKKWDKILIRV